jgi:phage-related protein
MKRAIYFYGSRIETLFESLDKSTIEKIEWTINLVKQFDRVPKTYLKYLKGTNSLYEIRCQWTGSSIRLLCFFDQNNLLIIVHGFIKKTQKTPVQEINIAEKIKRDYYEKKGKQ